MNYNLNYLDITIRYSLAMIFGILAGVLHAPWMVFIVLIFFLEGILAWCPVYYLLGINHCTFQDDA